MEVLNLIKKYNEANTHIIFMSDGGDAYPTNAI